MKVCPFYECSSLSKADLQVYECSDRILLCRAFFQRASFPLGPLLLRISNALQNSVVGAVKDLHDDEDIVYVPQWMIHSLQLLSNVTLSTVPQRPCTSIVLRPFHKGAFSEAEWPTVLSAALRNYNTLTKGAVLPLDISGIEFVKVEALVPVEYNTVFMRMQESVQIAVRASVEAEKQSEYKPRLLVKGTRRSNIDVPESNPIVCFVGEGHTVGGSAYDASLSPSQLAFQAAVARASKNEVSLH